MLMRKYHLVSWWVGLIALVGCATSPDHRTSTPAAEASPSVEAPAREVHPFAQPIEAAQGAKAFRSHEALRFEFALRYQGDPDIELLLEVIMKTDMSRIRMQKANGDKLIWDGAYAYVSPADADWARPRFTVLTWPYFLCAPFKLSDPGTQLTPQGTARLMDSTFSTAKLTFGADVGDSPDDWYLLYRDDHQNLLRAMAYIVTYSKSQSEAETDPHAISYHDFTEVEGVTFPTEFRFWNWDEAEGLTKRRGTARLGGFQFIKTDKFTFGIPLSYRQYDRDGEVIR
jgi:hypothetical protein